MEFQEGFGVGPVIVGPCKRPEENARFASLPQIDEYRLWMANEWLNPEMKKACAQMQAFLFVAGLIFLAFDWHPGRAYQRCTG
jgi:hypothetical protein